MGFFGDLGFSFTVFKHLNLGAMFSFSQITADVQNEDLEIGGSHITVFTGYHW
jgi:hypothetical protein